MFAGWPAALRGRAAAANHSITVGLGDFDLVTEQYLVLADEDIEVLATTTQPVRRLGPMAPRSDVPIDLDPPVGERPHLCRRKVRAGVGVAV